MKLQQRINAFNQLGKHMLRLAQLDAPAIENGVLRQAEAHNSWFTQDNLEFALEQWGRLLSRENLVDWLKHYPASLQGTPKTVGIVMAGNIPLVGFHDLLCVLVTGHRALVKPSSKAPLLLTHLMDELLASEPGFEGAVRIEKERLEGFDAVIATGSNNTARYFEHYFGKYPGIIRHNRNSVAVLDGKETAADLQALGEDIFRYFGLGCRNVSKIYVPEEYDFGAFFKAVYDWKAVAQHPKYMNNYDYNKAVYLMSDLALLDNEFLLLKEDEAIASPIGVLFYERYRNRQELSDKLATHKDAIQVVVGSGPDAEVPFGRAQMPALSDYADGVDTLKMLHGLGA